MLFNKSYVFCIHLGESSIVEKMYFGETFKLIIVLFCIESEKMFDELILRFGLY